MTISNRASGAAGLPAEQPLDYAGGGRLAVHATDPVVLGAVSNSVFLAMVMHATNNAVPGEYVSVSRRRRDVPGDEQGKVPADVDHSHQQSGAQR